MNPESNIKTQPDRIKIGGFSPNKAISNIPKNIDTQQPNNVNDRLQIHGIKIGTHDIKDNIREANDTDRMKVAGFSQRSNIK